MIRYSLKCGAGHDFDSWFASSDAFDTLKAAGHLACAVCGGGEVEKAVMAPRVSSSEAPEPERPLSAPASPAEQALAELRRRIEATSEDMGRDFAAEARRIHEGEAPARPIYGEATLREAKRLLSDEIPVTPLPWGRRSG